MAAWEAYLCEKHGGPLPAAGGAAGGPPGAHAVYASQRHSRALTAAAALRRLGLLPRGAGGDCDDGALRVTVAGADRHEGACDAGMAAAVFRELALAAAAGGATSLRLLLLGPAVPRQGVPPAQFAVAPPPPSARSARSGGGGSSSSSSSGRRSSSSDADAPLRAHRPLPPPPPPPPPPPLLPPPLTLRVAFAHGELCDPDAAPADADAGADPDADSASRPPHLVIAFNAGVWGYGGWAASLRAAAATLRCACVVTAYSREECEDDEDVLRAAGLRFIWEAEPNPHASLRRWVPLAEAPGGAAVEEEAEARADNAWWLCVAPEGWDGDAPAAAA